MPSFSTISNTNGVKYIKINKTSSNGLDRTAYLEQLQSINIRFDDVGVVEYQIVSAQQFDEYYLFGINDDPTLTNQYGVPQYPISSSTDNEIKDYHLDARKSYSSFYLLSSSIGITPPLPITVSSIIDYTSTFIDASDYFNTSSGLYTLGITPNINNTHFYSTSSFWLTGSGTPGTYVNVNSFLLLTRNNTVIGSISPISQTLVNFANISNGNDLQIIHSHSFNSGVANNLLEGDSISLAVCTTQPLINAGGTDVYLWRQLKFEISQSIPPTSSIQITAFNPDEINFYYSDYNALYGNASLPEYSQYRMEVDYNNQLTPVNFNQLIDGTALRAKVQDSNYASKAWTTLRYNGSQYSSISSPLNNGFNSPAQPPIPDTLDTGYGNLPAAEQNETYFVYFNGIGGTGPEIINQTAYFIKYIIDDEGNTVNPESILNPFSSIQQNISLNNLIDTFEPGKNAVVSLISNDPLLTGNPNDDALVGVHPITHVGRIDTLAVSQTGQNVIDYTSSLGFTPPTSTYANYDYSFLAKWASPQILTGSVTGAFVPVKYSNVTLNPNLNYNSTTYSYGIPTDTSEFNNPLKFISTLAVSSFAVSNEGSDTSAWTIDIPATFKLRIVTSSASTPNVYDYVLASSTNTISNPLPSLINVSSSFLNFTSGSRIRVEIQVNWAYSNDPYGLANGEFPTIYQTNNSKFFLQSSYGNAITASANYWTTGSNNDRYLTASAELTNYYNLGYIQQLPPSSSAFGFNNIVSPFIPQPGDYIRFEYNPLKVFNIKNVITATSSSNLILDVGYPIPAGTVIDNFVLYRIVNDGTYVILNVQKPVSGSSFTGIMRPQFMSQKLINSSSIYIQNLVEKGVIS
jgi:hypothetical protein